MPEKAQKSLFVEKSNKFCKKKYENWIVVNIEFSLRRKQIRKKSQDWISDLLTVLTNLFLKEKI